MAGSGNGLTTWASSAAYHQDKGDYNDNVIVPRSILVDTADAIRIKKSGTAEVKSDVDVSGETFLTSSSITPEDFATEIANITSGNSFTSTDFQTQTLTYQEAAYSVKQTTMNWYGDYRKVAFMMLDGSRSSSSSTQHTIYIYVPYCLTLKYTYNNKVLIPLINISISGISGNSFINQFGPNTSPDTNMSSGSNRVAILWNDLEASKNGSDNTQYTATIYNNYGNDNDSSVWLPYNAKRTTLYYPSATNKIVLE